MTRNRNRQPGPIRRTIIGASPAPTVGTDPSLRTPSRTDFTGPGPRLGRAKGGGQPSGNGAGLSAWSHPMQLPYSISVTASDPRWSATSVTNPA